MADSLSQSEVEALLSGLDTRPSESARREDSAKQSPEDLPYAELARQLATALCANLTSEFEHALRGRCEVRFAGFTTSSCAEALAGLDARCVAVIESRQAGSHSLVAMNSGAVFPMIDCLLGGGSSTAQAAIPQRPLTDIELKLISRCAAAVADSLERAWSQFHPAEFQVAHIEGRIPAAQLISPREQVVSLKLDTTISGLTGQLTFVLAERSILNLASQAGLSPKTVRNEDGSSEPARLSEVRVRLASLQVEAATVASLKIGDVLPLGPDRNLPEATVLVDGEAAFTAEPGLNAGRKAVRIKSAISAERAERHVE